MVSGRNPSSSPHSAFPWFYMEQPLLFQPTNLSQLFLSWGILLPSLQGRWNWGFFRCTRAYPCFLKLPTAIWADLGSYPRGETSDWRCQVLLVKSECILKKWNFSLAVRIPLVKKPSLKRWWWWSLVGKRWFSTNGAKRIFKVWFGFSWGFFDFFFSCFLDFFLVGLFFYVFVFNPLTISRNSNPIFRVWNIFKASALIFFFLIAATLKRWWPCIKSSCEW